MILLLKISLLFAGLLMPSICGYPLLRFLCADKQTSKIERFILAFLSGWLIFFAIFAVAGFANFGFNLQGGIAFIAIAYGVIFCLFRKKEMAEGNVDKKVAVKREENCSSRMELIVRYSLVLLSAVMFLIMIAESIGDTESMPMQAIWGYKAMVKKGDR